MIDTASQLAVNVKAVIPEDGQHALVFGENVAFKKGNAIVAGHVRQPLDKPGTYPLAVVGILDGESDPRRALIGKAVITPDGDDFLALLLLYLADQGKSIFIIHRTETKSILRPHLARVTLKTEVFGLLTEPAEKGKPALGVVPAYRPEQYPGAVPEQDFGLILCGIR